MSPSNVLIAGGGTMGLVQALALGRAGVDVTILDPGHEPPTMSRALVLDWSMMDGLHELGLLDDMVAMGLVQTSWSLHVLRTGETLTFDLTSLAEDVERPFNLTVSTERMVALLLARVEELPNVRIEWRSSITGIEQDDDGCTVTAHGPDGPRDYRCGWIVGADGLRSQVRRLMGQGFPGMTWPERFVVVNLRFDFASTGVDQAASHIDPHRGALIAQIDGTGLWQYLYAENERLPEATLEERMRSRFADALPEGAEPHIESWSSGRMHQRFVDSFRRGRVILVGDAAHVTAPTSGYAAAAAFFDVLAASEVLAAMAHGEGDASALERYAVDRRRVFTEIAGPVASETKTLVFDGLAPHQIELELRRYRAACSSRQETRDFLLHARELRSPSLVG
ncbi:FAD-dependent oxidoreductase [Nocardioides acrostichi]|uniref:FAD-dependent monooxygenase n=1 Tax=Nocardioides acrostichi TaxID=2784339 RepID=A0A930UZ08_9ACTN|nr:NAD(P)/FAD-dependent oxidoreductase [Nocardioides acrostichi]MBF4162701.1 FAD-dependent monooxygenase [Nocardioides acrostichi]